MFNPPLHSIRTSTAFSISKNCELTYLPSCTLIHCWCCQPGTTKIEVWLIGGGGGGGGGGVAGGCWGGGGAGGAGGGISSCIFYGNQIPASATVCLGSGGAGGAGSISFPFTCATNGTNGGMTSFGSLVHAGGGGGGQRGRSVVSNQTAESSGGAGGTGNFLLGGTGGDGSFFPTAFTCATPGQYPSGGGAGGGAGAFCGCVELQAASSGNLANLNLPKPGLGFAIYSYDGGDGGAQCAASINGENPDTFNCLIGGGGGGGGGAIRGGTPIVAGSGGLGSPGVALVISYF